MSTRLNWRVLVFPGGTEVGLEIARSLAHCKNVRLFSGSADVPNHAPFVYRHHELIPQVTDERWFAALIDVVRRHAITTIFPAHALVIDALAKERDRLPEHCTLAMASDDVLQVTRSKRATYRQLSPTVVVPRLFDSAAVVDSYPVFVKPDRLYGAQGAQRVESRVELEALLARKPELLISEYLPGPEYTVDCFSDRHGALRFCAARQRQRIRMGTSMCARLAEPAVQERAHQLAEQILAKLPLRGAWFFQLKQNSAGQLALLEVEARIAGTMALNRARGINFALLSLYDLAGQDVDIQINPHQLALDRALTNRYRGQPEYDHVYVDLDDTLLVDGRVNTQLVAFLYQCLNGGKNITLLSKSLARDKPALLARHRLQSLFDDVIWLAEHDSKADFIVGPRAIFIDDSFSQRREVFERHHIPTFDPNMVESLLDERV